MDYKEEVWKKIEGFDGYEISNKGRVKSYKKKKPLILKGVVDVYGYVRNGLYIDSGIKIKRIHRLVAMAFIKNPHNKPDVNHIDGNKENNNVENLEWCTPKENIHHAIKIGTNNQKGENHALAKLTYEQSCEIRIRLKNGEKIGFLSKEYGVNLSTIKRIRLNKSYKLGEQNLEMQFLLDDIKNKANFIKRNLSDSHRPNIYNKYNQILDELNAAHSTILSIGREERKLIK